MSLLLAICLLWVVESPPGGTSNSGPGGRTATEQPKRKVLDRVLKPDEVKKISAVSEEFGGWAILSAPELQKYEQAAPLSGDEAATNPPQAAANGGSAAWSPPVNAFGDPIPWVLRKPTGAPVDKELLEGVLTALNKLVYTSDIPPSEAAEELEAFALEPPKLLLTVDDAKGKIVLSFGNRHPLSGRRYVLRQDTGRVLIADDTVFNLLNVTADTFRDKRPLRFDPARVRAVTLTQRTGQSVVLRRMADNQWVVEQDGARMEADAGAVMETLRALSEVRVRRFVDETPETLGFFGLTVPKTVIGLFMDNAAPSKGAAAAPQQDPADEERRVVLQIGEGVGSNLIQDPEQNASPEPTGVPAQSAGAPATLAAAEPASKLASYIKVRGVSTIYELTRSAPSEVSQGAERYWYRRPFDAVDAVKAAKLVVRMDGSERTMERGAEGWKQIGSSPGALSPEAASAFAEGLVEELKQFQVLSYLQPSDVRSEMGLDRPFAEIELWPAGGGMAYKMSIGSELTQGGPVGGSGKRKPAVSVPRYARLAVPVVEGRPARTPESGHSAVISGESWGRISRLLQALIPLKNADDQAGKGGSPSPAAAAPATSGGGTAGADAANGSH